MAGRIKHPDIFWIICFLAAVVSLLPACRQVAEDRNDPGPAGLNSNLRARFVVNIDRLRLREKAGEEGKVVTELPGGSILYDLGEVSPFTTKVKLRGVQYNEPWLKVETEDGLKGWVYGGALHFELKNSGATAKVLMKKRMQTLFGAGNEAKLQAYRKAFENMTTETELTNVFRSGLMLREILVDSLAQKIRVDDGQPPDLFWLKEAMPGFIPQLIAEGAAYYLFADYRAFLGKAEQTAGKIDDEFIDLCLQLYPEDSIEYFFPAWTIQTWDYGGHSLLGRGIHRDILTRTDRLLSRSDLFQKELEQIIADLINDITMENVTYWESQEKILLELDDILGDDLNILDIDDRVALETRKDQFANPDRHGIMLDYRSGIH